VDYDYVYAIETDYHVYIRAEPNTDSDVRSEVEAGIRMLAASEISGGDYSDCGGGNEWYPVQYQWDGGTEIHGFLAKGCCHLV
jgi:hypothetical protein